jgi:transposase
MTQISEEELPPFAVSRRTAAKLFDVSIDHVDDLIRRGDLEAVCLGKRRKAVTWRSMQKLLETGAAA